MGYFIGFSARYAGTSLLYNSKTITSSTCSKE